MKHTATEYAEKFVCACGDCPDTCCAAWEIIIDPESRARYEMLRGALGEQVHSAIEHNREGEPCWKLDSTGRCALLDAEGLCTLQRELGETAQCDVCRKYPRFTREYGAIREEGVSLSCPEVMRMLAESGRPVSFRSWESGAAVKPNDLDPEMFLSLKRMRQTAFMLLADRDYSIRERLALLLYFADDCQYLLDCGRYSRSEALCAKYEAGIKQKSVLKDAARFRFGGATRLEKLLAWSGVLSGLEILTERWQNLLSRFRDALMREVPKTHRNLSLRDSPERESLYEKYAVCTVYKYWLEASDDGKLLPLVQQTVFEVLLLRELIDLCGNGPDRFSADVIEFGHLLARELEHNEDNLTALRNVFTFDSDFSRKAMLEVIF